MITTLTGSNIFAINQTAKMRVNDFVKNYGDLALEKLEGDETDLNKIRESLESLPFLSAKKMVVLKEPGVKKEFAESIEDLLSDLPDTTELIIAEPKIDKRTVYYKFLKNKTDFQEYNELAELELLRWIQKYASGLGGSISSADARYLLDRVGSDQYLLANEVAKLATYKDQINKESIDFLTSKAPKSTVFELLDASFSGNKKLLMQIYDEQRALRVEPQQILAMLAWQLNILAILASAPAKSDMQIAKEAKLNPFVVQKSRRLMSRLGLEQIKELVSKLVQLDRESKTSSIDTDNALKAYLIAISQATS